MNSLNVELGERSYPIFIGSNLFDDRKLISPFLGKSRVVVITNSVVGPLYLETVKGFLGFNYDSSIILPDGEEHKNLDSVGLIYDHLLRGKYDRKTSHGFARKTPLPRFFQNSWKKLEKTLR